MSPPDKIFGLFDLIIVEYTPLNLDTLMAYLNLDGLSQMVKNIPTNSKGLLYSVMSPFGI